MWGYSESEGKQEDCDLNKMAGDLDAVIKYARQQFGGRIIIIAHSLGTLVTRVLQPENIEKIIFTGITPPDVKQQLAGTIKRLLSRPGGEYNEQGISIYPRKDGTIQKVGSNYWQSFENVDPIKLTEELAKKTKLFIIKPKQDEVIGGAEVTEAYKTVSNVNYRELDGDHNFSKPEDRESLLKTIKQIINQ